MNHSLIGIDEVGRGCWAGPLVAAAVILPANRGAYKDYPCKLGDSKVLNRAEREVADVVIHQEALVVVLGWVTPREIDEQGLTMAVSLAMTRAIDQITLPYDGVIIDGNYNFLCERTDLSHKVRAIVGADATVPAVSCASIVAKVARDKYMTDAAVQYPEYGFERHVGYGTKLHQEMLKLHGLCELHRVSYKPIKAIQEAI